MKNRNFALPSLSLLLFSLFLLSRPIFAALPAHDAAGIALPSLAPMLEQVNPAVVNIATYSTRQQAQNPLLNDPFFRRFFNVPRDYGRQAPVRRQQSAGSGVIIDAGKGIVMTNFHVIQNADEVQVSLVDGRIFDAEVIGTDPELDIAILNIDAEDLSEVALADSSQLRVGDFVVAIGNPFGLGQTVTTGIVSALGRTGLGIEGYENFIQTDASINPGNSGGALVNLRGELVGINTAIIAPAGGNVGIGFAIPINMAHASMSQIVETGEVRRGRIGVGTQDITPELREAFHLENGQFGVLVASVEAGSPADEAGLRPGDVILEIDGNPTSSNGQLRNEIGMRALGDAVSVGVLRDGKEKTIVVEVRAPKSVLSIDGRLSRLLNGVDLKNAAKNEGVLVTSVPLDSRAAYAGLRPDDLIVAVNRQRTQNIQEFQTVLKSSRSSVLLQIRRKGRSLFVVVR